jgi:hypothetical protein
MPVRGLIKKYTPRPALSAYRTARYGRHAEMAMATEGLLSVNVYRELTAVVSHGPRGRDIIEIGGAGGSATIAMAWGLNRCTTPCPRIVVVEKCEGGTRTQYGNWETNRARFERFVRSYARQRDVILFPHYLTLENGSEVRSLVKHTPLAGIMADADGMVHRDLFLFGELLSSDSFVVIDDYHPHHSPKHEITFGLVNRLLTAGVFIPRKLIDGTFFGTFGRAMPRSLYAECEEFAQATCRRLNVVFDARGITPTGVT